MNQDHFGQFGKILKIVINRNSHYNSGPAPTVGAYVTFARREDAAAAVRGIGECCIISTFKLHFYHRRSQMDSSLVRGR